MTNSKAKRKARISTYEMIMCGLFAALTAVGAFIKVPIPVVPFTLQFFFTMMAGIVLGSKLGAVSVSIYMFLGLAGVPIFAEGGGIAYVFKPSFGYIIGFVVGTFVTGLLIEHMKDLKFLKLLVANLAGLICVYLIGMAYYYLISNYVLGVPIDLWTVVLYCFILAVPGDIALSILAAIVGKKLIPVNRKFIGR